MWVYAVSSYLAIGMFIVFFTRAKTLMVEENDFDPSRVPRWKIILFYTIVYLGGILLWPVFLKSWFSPLNNDNRYNTTNSEGNSMFGFFKSKKQEPKNALDALIHSMYGNPPPPKTAKLDQAVQIAYSELLLEAVAKSDVASTAAELITSPIPYSTNDLALSVALNFFKSPEKIDDLREAQMMARVVNLGWINTGEINIHLAKAFEETLYRVYKS
jgi:hypothetical protein